MRKRSDRPSRRRRGAALVVALVSLVLLTAIAGSLARECLARRTRRRAEEHRIQAEWLARSGLERAWNKLAAARDFRGESWEISAADLGQNDGALVVIQVEAVEGKPARRRVRVVADFPREESRRARHTIETELEPGGDASGEKP